MQKNLRKVPKGLDVQKNYVIMLMLKKMSKLHETGTRS